MDDALAQANPGRRAGCPAFRQVAEQGGAFPGQHAGQPMSHAGQDEFALTLALELSLPVTWRPVHRSFSEVGSFT